MLKVASKSARNRHGESAEEGVIRIPVQGVQASVVNSSLRSLAAGLRFSYSRVVYVSFVRVKVSFKECAVQAR